MDRRCFLKKLGVGVAAVSLPGCNASSQKDLNAKRPNIIIIMTDDMGFSDLGCYGSEIDTANLDGLAAGGIRFTQFYNTGRCCPTRASLLTGLYSHQAGVGGMTGDAGDDNPGYRGRLMPRCVTIGEVLGASGYRTIQTGKWHVGSKQKSWWPVGRGFDRSYSCPEGGGFYYRLKAGRSIVMDDKVIYDKDRNTPNGWYATDAWTDEGLKFMREAVDMKKPFLWYLAYNAPHWPLMAKPEDIARYRGRYKAGWDEIRLQRYKRLVELGIIDSNWKLSPRGKGIPEWNKLTEKEKDEQDLRMATYAAMIDCVDQNVGKIIKELKELRVYENTLILFLHDNGGSAEGGVTGSNKSKGATGTIDSFVKYGACWANASNTPFRKYKKWEHEGGNATPLIAHWPLGIAAKMKGKLFAEPTHVIDLMPTCVDISSSKYPKSYKGNRIIPVEGKSLRPIFKAETFKRDEPIFFEHYGNKAVRKGKWKLVSVKGGKWELYDMDGDRTELNDLAKTMPDKLKELSAQYDAWSKRCFVNKSKVKSKSVT